MVLLSFFFIGRMGSYVEISGVERTKVDVSFFSREDSQGLSLMCAFLFESGRGEERSDAVMTSLFGTVRYLAPRRRWGGILCIWCMAAMYEDGPMGKLGNIFLASDGGSGKLHLTRRGNGC